MLLKMIHCLKNTLLADEYQKSLQTDVSAANMIDLAGKVLKETKAERTYDDWMMEEFENIRKYRALEP